MGFTILFTLLGVIFGIATWGWGGFVVGGFIGVFPGLVVDQIVNSVKAGRQARLNAAAEAVIQRQNAQEEAKRQIQAKTDSGESSLKAVAGMSPLKKQLREEVVDDLAAHGQPAENKEEFKAEDLTRALQAALIEINESAKACTVVMQRITLICQSTGCNSREDLDDWLKVSGVAAQKMDAFVDVVRKEDCWDDWGQAVQTFVNLKQVHATMTSNVVKRLNAQPNLADVVSSIVSSIENLQNEMASHRPDLSGEYRVFNVSKGTMDFIDLEKK
jgi:hypothetical protein